MAEENTTQVVRRSGLETMEFNEANRLAEDLVRSAITSLKKPVSIPSTEGVDLTSAESELEIARTTRDETTKTIDIERTRLGRATEERKEAITAEGKAASEKILADQARQQNVIDLQQQIANILNISLDPNSDIAIAAARVRELTPIAEAKLRRVQEMQSVGLLDNPLEWLTNQIQLPAAIGDYNAEAQVVNSLQSAIDSALKAQQDIAVAADKGIATISTASAKADADKILAAAAQNKAIADENLAKNSVTFAVQKLSNDITIANADKTMSQLQLQNEQTRYQSMINAINIADNHATRLLKAAELIEKIQDTKAMDVIFENYDRIMGHPKGTMNKYIFAKFAEPQRQNIVAIGTGSVGSGPLEGAINFRMSRPGPGVSPETRKLFNFINHEIDVISSDPKIGLIDTKLQPNVIDKRLKEALVLKINDASNPDNIFYEMSPAKMIASGAIPADSKLAKILEPFTNQTGNIPTEVILNSIVMAYPNPGEAGAVISDYYTANMKLRNSVMNTSLIGIQLPKNYKFKTSIEKENAFLGLESKMTFDLTKPEEATKYVTAKRVSDIVRMQSRRIGTP